MLSRKNQSGNGNEADRSRFIVEDEEISESSAIGGGSILFISDKESFILKSIMKNLANQGQNVIFAPFDIEAIEEARDYLCGLIYMYVEDISDVDMKTCVYLRDLCAENDYDLFIMGYEQDINELREQCFNRGIAGEYLKPINAKEVAAEIIEDVGDEAAKMRRKHILLVDDSGTMLTTIKSWLDDKYRITMVNSAMNAITFLATQTPDLILLDYEMPACTGGQFLEMMKADEKITDIPVIFLTAHQDAETVKEVIALKPAGYLLKSLPKEEIVKAVDEFFMKQKM